ncbi:uncharacterized protein LY89DRAFT_732413 [Mollisia scopiformis]|uniref:Clr5 domain-containing protein n=1 Tax=Mollisia scopiformis TaxID=149040 RepID=A0A194XFG2_MOLSC|nr:uncharacterized protein LY89DRAFT_732413 [Mollisia scopiformis]KUJ18874.1 hypothetical protein LY89DRAFT_732413 [Mollisia scopiformis]
MTKHWEPWKDEITRLYLTKSKTLEEVQGILRSRGFDASIRAYRMKLDAWGIRKNTSTRTNKKRRRECSQPSEMRSGYHDNHASSSTSLASSIQKDTGDQLGSSALYLQPSLDANNTSTTSDFDARVHRILALHNCVLPAGPMDANQLMDILGSTSYGRFGSDAILEILLLKWQADGEYLRNALDWVAWMDGTPLAHIEGNLFKILDAKLRLKERVPLAKACLIRLKESGPISRAVVGDWRWLLNVLNETKTWAVRKRILDPRKYHVQREDMGQCFIDCVPIVFAEDSLASLMNSWEDMMYNGKTKVDNEKLKRMRSEYMDILDDFSDATLYLDLDKSYYKFALLLSKWYEEERRSEEAAKTLDDSRGVNEFLSTKHSEIQLLVSSRGEQVEQESSESSEVVLQMEVSTVSTVDSGTTEVSSFSRPAIEDNSVLAQTQEVFDNLYQTWVMKLDLGELPLIPLTLDRSNSPSSHRLGINRLFGLISLDVPLEDRVPFTKAILDSFGGDPRFHGLLSYQFVTSWFTLYEATTWYDYKREHDQVAGWHWDPSEVSKENLRTILDYTTVLVGKRLLGNLDREFKSWSTQAFVSSRVYRDSKREFDGVIEWFTNHLDLLEADERLWLRHFGISFSSNDP